MKFTDKKYQEVKKLAFLLKNQCVAYFELPRKIWTQIKIEDNFRRQKLNTSYDFCDKIVTEMLRAKEI